MTRDATPRTDWSLRVQIVGLTSPYVSASRAFSTSMTSD